MAWNLGDYIKNVTQFKETGNPYVLLGTNDPPDAANPNDPSQLRTWALDMARKTAEGSELFSHETLKSLSQMFEPYFKQAQSSYASKFNQAMTSQVGQAQNAAGAYAAYKGLNPASFIQNAGQGVRSKMTPEFMSGLSELISNQNNALLSGASQANKFKTGNMMNAASMILNGSQMAAQLWDQPDFWDYLSAGIGSGIGNLPAILGA